MSNTEETSAERVSSRKNVRWLTIGILLAAQAVLVALHVGFTWARAGTYPVETVLWFDVGYEANLPTAFSVGQLVMLATVAAVIARRKRSGATWYVVALAALFLAADEAFEIHEALGTWLGGLVERSSNRSPIHSLRSFGSYYWILLYGPIAAVGSVALTAFLYRELRPGWRLASSGLLLCLLGALGLDYLEGRYGTPNHDRIPILLFGRFFRFDVFLVEECLEMFGVTLMIAGLMAHGVTLREKRP
jgi:hypothetical protein